MSHSTTICKSHATEFNLFPPKQSAYRQFHSTETAVLSVHNDIVRAVDNRELSLLVLLDLSAAFDTVDHHIVSTFSKIDSVYKTLL